MKDDKKWLNIKNEMVIRMSHKAIGMGELTKFFNFVENRFNEHETQLKAKDERIKELEEAMKHKTCQGCVHEVEDMQDLHCAFCSRSCDDNFEPKDNA